MRAVDFCLFASLAAFLPVSTGPVLAADLQPGRLLYETHCGACHYEKLHERKSTTIKSVAGLRAEAEKWSWQTSRRFTPAELDDIAEYLNQSHYRLAK